MQTVQIRVKPNAPKNKIVEKNQYFWKVAVAAKPTGGDANRELVKFLESKLGKHVEILRGKTSKKKLIRLSS